MVTWSNSFSRHLSLEPDDVGDAGVSGRHDAQWQEVLCQHDRQGVPVAPASWRPLFLTIVKGCGAVVGRQSDDARQRGYRKRQRQCRRPDDDEGAYQLASGEPGPHQVPDRSVSVHADGDQSEGAEEDGDGLGVADERAQGAAEGPVLEQNVGDERKRYTDGRHQRVGARQVQYEPVSDCSHTAFDDDDGDDQRVPANRDDDDGQVESNKQDARVDRKHVRIRDDRRVIAHSRWRVFFTHDCSAIFCRPTTGILSQDRSSTNKINSWCWSCNKSCVFVDVSDC